MVLYRKYRPQTFAEVVGQEHVVQTLQNTLAKDAVAHAYLFTGPRGTGKTTVARLLAAALNCEHTKNKKEPCNSCERCKEILTGSSLDLVEIDAASNRGIDEIRNLKEGVRFASPKGAYKVYLVDEVHMLTKEAFNAFLKTLEEPPENVVFILATTEPHKLPATVISRTQRFDFRRIYTDEIRAELARLAQEEGVEQETEALSLIAREADGSLRDATSLFEQVLSFGGDSIQITTVEEALGVMGHGQIKALIEHLAVGDLATAFEWLEEIVSAGQDVHQLSNTLVRYLRLLMWVQIGGALIEHVTAEVGDDVLAQLREHAELFSRHQTARWLQLFTTARTSLERYPLPQIALEVALVEGFGDKESTKHSTEQKDTKNENQPKDGQAGSGADDADDADNKNISSDTEKKDSTSAPADEEKSGDSHDPMLSSIQEQWSSVVEQLKEYNHSLFAIVKAAEPHKIEKGTLTVRAQYAFNKDRMHERSNRKAIEDAIETVHGTRLRLRCVLEK